MKTNTKNFRPAPFRFHPKRPIGWMMLGIIGLLVAGQLTFDVYAVRRLDRPADATVMTNLIISAVEGLVRPLPVNATTDQMQLASLRLVWPASAEFTGQVLYSNTTGQDSTAALQLTSRPIMHSVEAKLWSVQTHTTIGQNVQALFTQAPGSQACTRGVQLFFAPQTNQASQWQDRGSVRLKDGRTAYFYTESTCRQDLTGLLGYLKHVQSY